MFTGRNLSLVLCAVVLGTVSAAAQGQGTITTVAGGAFPAVGRPAIAAPLGEVHGVAVDSAGNVYAGHLYGSYGPQWGPGYVEASIVRISPGGTLGAVAGSQGGATGDGGPATRASLSGSAGTLWLVVDGVGNVYVADIDNNKVRKITPEGAITTVATSLKEPMGLATDAAGNLYVADHLDYRVRKVTPGGIITIVAGDGRFGFSGDGGPATRASLCGPNGLAVDSVGNLYITDRCCNVRKVTRDGTIQTIAGNGRELPLYPHTDWGDGGAATTATLGIPAGLAVDESGNLYIAASGRVRQVSPAGIITTFAGGGNSFPGDGGPATAAALLSPQQLAVDVSGNLYIADSLSYRVRKVSRTGIITTVAGSGSTPASDGIPAATAWLGGAAGAALHADGSVYVSEEGLHRVRRIRPDGTIVTVAGRAFSYGSSGDGRAATSALLWYPTRLATDLAGNLFIADKFNHRIRRVDSAGTITTFAGHSTEGFSGDSGPATIASLSKPQGVAVDASGSVYIADTGNHSIRKVSPGGIITTLAGNGVQGYSGDGGPATAASLRTPSALAVDAAENVYIADTYNHRIRKISPGGMITTVAGNGVQGYSGDGGPATTASLSAPSGVAVDAVGNVYIADAGNYRVRRVSLAGSIISVAGNGQARSSGDDGPATTASLVPLDVTVDVGGNLYLVDGRNSSVRLVRFAPPAPFTLSAVNGASFGVPGSPLTPGAIVSIFGSGIDPSVSLSTMASFVSSNPPTLPTSLAGVSVKFGGSSAALFFVGVGSAIGMAPGAFQINCQAPMEIALGAVSLQVFYNNALIATGTANIAGTGPGIFTMTQNGQGQAVVLNEDGSLNGDPAHPAVPGIQPRPAQREKAIVIYGSGPGSSFKDSKTGQPLTLGTGQAASCAAEPLYVTAETPVVTIGTVPAQVLYSGLAPCFVGLWQLNVQVPAHAPTGGAVPLVVSIGGRVSNTAAIAVQ